MARKHAGAWYGSTRRFSSPKYAPAFAGTTVFHKTMQNTDESTSWSCTGTTKVSDRVGESHLLIAAERSRSGVAGGCARRRVPIALGGAPRASLARQNSRARGNKTPAARVFVR